MVTGFVPLKYLTELTDVTACLTLSTARWCSGPHWNLFSFLIRSQRQANNEAKLGTNRLRNCTTPYPALVGNATDASFTCTLYDSPQVCIMVIEVMAVK